MSTRCHFVAVTGAQGVGKSTFCESLLKGLQQRTKQDVHLMAGLAARVAAMGIPLGSASTSLTIPAIFTAHLERELEAKSGIVVLDRCVFDALAYTRCLHLTGPEELRLYEAIAASSARWLSLVVHLRLSPFFSHTGSAHETPDLRRSVANEISQIVARCGRPVIELDADDPPSVSAAIEAALRVIHPASDV